MEEFIRIMEPLRTLNGRIYQDNGTFADFKCVDNNFV